MWKPLKDNVKKYSIQDENLRIVKIPQSTLVSLANYGFDHNKTFFFLLVVVQYKVMHCETQFPDMAKAGNVCL